MKTQVWGVSTGRPETPPEERPQCSFCGRAADETRRILVTPGASICGECAATAEAVLAESIPAR